MKIERICLVTEELAGFQGSGGIGAAFSELAILLASHAYHVDILYCPVEQVSDDAKNNMRKQLRDKGIKITFLDYEKYFWGAPTYEKKSYAVYQHLKSKTYDIIHFHDFKGLGFASVSAKRQGMMFETTQFVVQMHGPTVWTIKTNNTLFIHEDQLKIDFMEREMIKKADHVISPSQYLLDYLSSEEDFIFPEGNTHVIKNLCSELENQIKPFIRLGRNYLEKINEIVLFARHEDRKGFRQFCDAIDELKTYLEENRIQVTFLGKFGTITDQPSGLYLANRGVNWNFPVRVISHFHRKEAANYLAGSDSSLVVIPSEENSPYTVFEALVLRKPLITSLRGGARELIAEDDHEKVLCDTSQGEHIASAIIQWIEQGGEAPKSAETSKEIEHRWVEFHESLQAQEILAPESNSDRPKVTFGITHYERPEKLIDAIISAVKQSYCNMEIVVVDDGSKTKTTKASLKKVEALLKRVGGKIIYQENGYLGAARNTIARNTESEYLCFLDDDDIAKTDLVQKLVLAAQTSGADIVNCLNQFMDVKRRHEGIVDPDGFDEKVSYVPLGGPLSIAYKQNVLGAATALIRRGFFERIGGYSEIKGVGHEDYEFFLKSLQAGGHIEIVPEPMYLYEVGRPSMISNTSSMRNFKRIHGAIEFDGANKAISDFINLEIGKTALEIQTNRMHYNFSNDRNAELILPILRGELSGHNLLDSLTKICEQIGASSLAAAFNLNKNEILRASGESTKKNTINVLRPNKSSDIEAANPFEIDFKIDISLGRYEDALNGIIANFMNKLVLSNEDISSLTILSESLGCNKLPLQSIESLIQYIEILDIQPNKQEQVVSSLDKIIVAASDENYVKEYVEGILTTEEDEYINRYADLQIAFNKRTLGGGFDHYIHYGLPEKRQGFRRYYPLYVALKNNKSEQTLN